MAARSVSDMMLAGTLAPAIIDEAEIGILLVDEQGRIRYANRAAEDMSGYPRDQLLVMTVDQLVPEDAKARHADYRREFSHGLGPRTKWMGERSLSIRLLVADGRQIPVRIGLTRLMSQIGRVVVAYISPRVEETAQASPADGQ